MSAVADKLREARGLVAEGWTQGRPALFTDAGTSYCAWGAVHHVCRGQLATRVAAVGALDTVAFRLGDESIIAWNDAHERTQSEVLAAFDKAIELAEQSA